MKALAKSAGKESPPTPTEEQIAILEHVRFKANNFMIRSYAGTGKTTTLTMVQIASRKQPVLCLAFSRLAVDEMKEKMPPNAEVRSFNSIGHTTWADVVGKAFIDKKRPKMNQLLSELIKQHKGADKQALHDNYWEILDAVDMAKNLGYIPEGTYRHAKRLTTKENYHARLQETPTPFIASVVDTLLGLSTKAAYEGWIDFNDQIYMPTLFGAPFQRYPLVLVDEVQDLNPVNHEMCRKLVTDRLGAVGDPCQSIYAFRGAVAEGMARMEEQFSCDVFDLSISFRCPRVIVEAARWRVPQFRWVKEGGSYEVLQSLDLDTIPDGAAILCRNNAPLFRLAFTLLANQRSVRVAGSDLGPRLVRLMQKIGDDRDSSEALCAKIDAWAHEKLLKANSPGTISDTADCMKVFASYGANLGQAVKYALDLFAQQGTLTLSTGHRAKGLEWNHVYFLDPWLLDSEEQDLNLRYVIQTRSAQALYEIDSKGIQW